MLAGLPGLWASVTAPAAPNLVAPVAAYLAAHHQGRDMVIDERQDFALIYATRHPEWFVQTIDADFAAVLGAPVGQVNYLVVRRQPGEPGADDRVTPLIDDAVRRGVGNWLVVDARFDPGWLLYRVSRG